MRAVHDMDERTNLDREPRWTDAVFAAASPPSPADGAVTFGVLPGEGIGPEVLAAALEVLRATRLGARRRLDVRFGGPIARDAELLCGSPLPEDVTAFCKSVFAEAGAVLAGPGGGRFVYDLRRHFDLFCKISPLRVSQERTHVGALDPRVVRGVDVLVIRENAGGLYVGERRSFYGHDGGRVCEQAFAYSEREVRRIVEVAAALAARRRGGLTVVVKDGGMPEMTALWREVAQDAGRPLAVRPEFVNIDLAAYLLVQEPKRFDVIVAPDLFGDVLADVGAVLLGSRGFSFSGNFSAQGAAVYQTNHGGAVDLAGSDRANPIGQISAVAMALRETFGLPREATWIERGVEEVLATGFRTFDIGRDGAGVIGTREMGERVAAAVDRIARRGT